MVVRFRFYDPTQFKFLPMSMLNITVCIPAYYYLLSIYVYNVEAKSNTD